MTRGEVVFDFCFYFLYFILSHEFSASYLSTFEMYDNITCPTKKDDENTNNNNNLYNTNSTDSKNNQNQNENIEINDTQNQALSLISKLPNFNITKTLKSPFSLLSSNSPKNNEISEVTNTSLSTSQKEQSLLNKNKNNNNNNNNKNNNSWMYISSSLNPSPSQISIKSIENNSFVPISNSFILSDFDENMEGKNKDNVDNSIYSVSNTDSNIGDFSFIDTFSVKSSTSNQFSDISKHSLSTSNKSNNFSKTLVNHPMNGELENIKDFALISPPHNDFRRNSLSYRQVHVNSNIIKKDLTMTSLDISNNSNNNNISCLTSPSKSKALIESKQFNNSRTRSKSIDKGKNKIGINVSKNETEKDKDLIFSISLDSSSKKKNIPFSLNTETAVTHEHNDINNSLTSPLIFSLDMNTTDSKETNSFNDTNKYFSLPNNTLHPYSNHYSRSFNSFNSFHFQNKSGRNHLHSPSPNERKHSMINSIILEEDTPNKDTQPNNSPSNPLSFSPTYFSPSSQLQFNSNHETSTSAPTITYLNTQSSPTSSSSSSSTFSSTYNQYRIRRNSQTNLDVLRFRNQMSYNSRLNERNYLNPTTHYSLKSYYEGRKLSNPYPSTSPNHSGIPIKSISNTSKISINLKSPNSNLQLISKSFSSSSSNSSGNHTYITNNSFKTTGYIINKKLYRNYRTKYSILNSYKYKERNNISSKSLLLKNIQNRYKVKRYTTIIKRKPCYYIKDKKRMLNNNCYKLNNNYYISHYNKYNICCNLITTKKCLDIIKIIKDFNLTITLDINLINNSKKSFIQKEYSLNNKIQLLTVKNSDTPKLKNDNNNNSNSNNNNNNNNEISSNYSSNCKSKQIIPYKKSFELIPVDTKIIIDKNTKSTHLWTCSCCSDSFINESNKEEALYYYKIIYGLTNETDTHQLPSYITKHLSNDNDIPHKSPTNKSVTSTCNITQEKQKLREYRLKAVRNLFLEARIWALNQQNNKMSQKESRW